MELETTGDGFAGTAFFARLYEEALALVRETRDYLAVHGPEDCRDLPPADGLAFSVETMRLTSRLTHIIAWLLVQRALAEGNLAEEQRTGERLRLGGAAIGLGEPPLSTGDLPPYLLDLIRRSERLFRRIQRLDERVTPPGA